MSDLALGVKVFSRTDKLEKLLRSAEKAGIEKAYVADDGNTENRSGIYNKDFSLQLEVLDLDYDAGLGYGRKRIVEETSEEYLLIVDSDHEIPTNYTVLQEILESDDTIGGVAGLFLEHGHPRGMFHDIYFDNNYMIRDIRNEKTIEMVNDHPFFQFDFVANAALFRTACFEDYNWDEEYIIGGEHEDFYLGHLDTEWRFGVTPSVLFPHYPGGDEHYVINRQSPQKLETSHRYLLDKFELNGIIPRQTWLWSGLLPNIFYSLLSVEHQYKAIQVLEKSYQTYRSLRASISSVLN